MPLFSIIIPVYNVEECIVDTLSSIDAQTFQDYEVIIVNDGSTDATAENCRAWCQGHPRFSLYTKKNGGVSSARNQGLEKAVGEYIWFIDGDDFIHPNSLNCISNFFQKHLDADYLAFRYCYSSKKYKETEFGILSEVGEDIIRSEGGNDFARLFARVPYAACCLCAKRESIGNLRFLPICTAEDTLFALSLTFQSTVVAYWAESPYFYYQRPGSFVNSRYTYRKYADYLRFVRGTFDLAKKYPEKGNGIIAFFGYRMNLPSLFKQGRMLETRPERKKAWSEFKNILDEFGSLFHGHSVWYARIAVRTHSFIFCWIVFYLRYEMRNIVLQNKALARLYALIRFRCRS